jgi:tRNA wybutosine-synthesizing protein 3
MILHITCKTIDDAQNMINIAKSSGFKRSGIQSTNKKINVEICGTDYIDTIIGKEGKVVVDDFYISILADEANNKMKRNNLKIKRFYDMVKGLVNPL